MNLPLKLTKKPLYLLVPALLLISMLPQLQMAEAAVQRVQITSGSNYLIVEALRDDIVHFELSTLTPPGTGNPIRTSPMIYKTDYTGPSSWSDTTVGSVRTLQTASIKVEVNTSTLCATVKDKTKVPELTLTTYCPLNLSQAWKGLTMTPETFTHGYGLGAQYITSGSADGDWIATSGHQVRSPGDNNGNQMVGWNGGAVGNTQYPVLYALGSGLNSYAMFMDNYYKQQWSFNVNPWKAEMWGDWLRWYVFVGPDVQDLRKDYMELVGRPLVPPKKMFGLWVSEYGYDNWTEMDSKKSTLISNNFPLDGFVLDLQWFGGVTGGCECSKMGKVSWDTVNFPSPATKLTNLKNNDGVGIMTIEESYVSKGLTEHTNLQNNGYLVREGCSTCAPIYIAAPDNDWWGRGGMIDWTSTAAGDYWHDTKRQALITDGVIGHWLDLNEPEIYHSGDWYAGFDPQIGLNPNGLHGEADVHNLFAHNWVQSVKRGYDRNGVVQRPFMMSRSGGPGIERYGATQWSGDIGSNYSSLATWSNVQMHMVMSGIDYYSSDIGGFHREACGGGCNLNELYTQWYATGMLLDIPGRPHTDNVCNCRETAPDRIGYLVANQDNTRRRYELSPYMYSLAYRAWLAGEPVVPPLVYYYQSDTNVRTMGHEKMIGKDLLVAIVAGAGEYKRDVYLPSGDWIIYDTNEWVHSTGSWKTGLPEYRGNQRFRLPLFARAGAIIPTMYVDSQTANVLGKRRDGSTHNELIVRTYASPTATNFTLYEDDGETKNYLTGSYRTTLLSQQKTSGTSETVTINASSGTYTGAPSSRNNVVTLVVENQTATAVTLNGSPLTQYTSQASFDAASSGWINLGYNVIQAKSGSQSVTSAKTFVFTLTSATAKASVNFVCGNGTTVSGQSVFVVGNIAELGSWNTLNAIKLDANVYPTWTGVIQNLPVGTSVEWKCIKRNNSDNGNLVWEGGSNNLLTTPASPGGFWGSTTDGSF